MTKLRQISQFSLPSVAQDTPAERYVSAMDGLRCVVSVLPADTDIAESFIVCDHQGQVLHTALEQPPQGTWSEPTFSFNRTLEWGVVQHEAGRRADTRVDDLARPLTIMEKMALSDAYGLRIPPPAIIGLVYSQPLYEVDLGERWLLREVGLAFGVQAADHDYDIRVLRVFHPLAQDALITPALDGVTLRHPTAPIRWRDLLVLTEMSASPTATIWKVDDA